MEWGFNSHEQLQQAGYTWRRHGFCGKCSRPVLWYTNPDRHFVPVDPGTFLIHFASCAAKPKPIDRSKLIDFGKRRRETRLFDFGDNIA